MLNSVELRLVRLDSAERSFHAHLRQNPNTTVTVNYGNQASIFDFASQIEEAHTILQQPFLVNVIDAVHGNNDVLSPSAIVIMPEYMVDVTSISGCYSDQNRCTFAYISNKLSNKSSGMATLAGHIVNAMTDAIIYTPEISFRDMMRRIFDMFPLELSFMSDIEVHQLIHLIKPQFENLVKTIGIDFPLLGINQKDIFVEPSFFSRDLGIQGRLDLLHYPFKSHKNDLIEVKSGKIFKPNHLGINHSHYMQAILYHMLIGSVFKNKTPPDAYILYSRDPKNTMRRTEPAIEHMYENLLVRNELVLLDLRTSTNSNIEFLMTELTHSVENISSSFLKRDLSCLSDVYRSLDDLERSYFNHQFALITKERLTCRIANSSVLFRGFEQYNNPKMESELMWDSIGTTHINGLTITENLSSQSDPILVLHFCQNKKFRSHIRTGELAILFPSDEHQIPDGVFENQVFKCTIISSQSSQITVKLRSRQNHQKLFESQKLWSLITDTPDSGYNSMSTSLFEWASAQKGYRDLILGKRPPIIHYTTSLQNIPCHLTHNQCDVFQKAIRGSEYFLLWGPPGTGKTHIMLKALTTYLIENTNENVLLLAYTNRAVDEICSSILHSGKNWASTLLRIGSRPATDPLYHDYLLDKALKPFNSRQGVKQCVQNSRLLAATLNSLYNKKDILKYKSFDTVIIDESSQIPEVMLIGLLQHFKKVILIGDHRQLPSVVSLEDDDYNVDCPEMRSSGIRTLRNSLFERLFNQARKNGWSHAFGLLNEQARMHLQLMEFPNKEFYENLLKPFPKLERQFAPAFLKNCPNQKLSLEKRKIFLHTENNKDDHYKTNTAEAVKCAEIVKLLAAMHIHNQKPLHKDSIGVVSPFKAQGGLIKQLLHQNIPEYAEFINVDTIERFQGSSRDVIILSTCISHPNQLSMILSLSDEGIDRKLNVAITRAREQFILIGNYKALSGNNIYRRLIDWMDDTR